MFGQEYTNYPFRVSKKNALVSAVLPWASRKVMQK